jgi:hypothetical protein
MYRPVLAQQAQQAQQQQQPQGTTSIKDTLFSGKNAQMLQTVLLQDFQERQGSLLTEPQRERLSKTVGHYLQQVYNKQGDKPVPILNKEVLSAASKDFSQYLQRKESTKNVNPVKQVMDDSLFQETSQRFERLTQERNEMKALPAAIPDFRISLTEDGPPAAEMFERAKKQREMEYLRSSQQQNELQKADAGLQQRIQADQSFRLQQDGQNRNMEMALVQRQMKPTTPAVTMDNSLVIMPDRRELLLAPIGSFDTMSQSPNPRELGQANSNPTIVNPQLASPDVNHLPQNYVVREDNVVSYREVENNLFIYSADRDWLINTKENRYDFTVNFDTAGYKDKFGATISAQQKFKNIVRIELIKAIMPGESLDVTVNAHDSTYSTTYQDNILNLPYVSLRVAELENNTYGTDNFLDRSFGVLQYDAQWVSDVTAQSGCTRGFLAMIPKFLKCQKEYYPTPLSTLQKMTIQFIRPNGELLSPSSDTFTVGGIIARGTPSGTFPFNVDVSTSPYGILNPDNLSGTSPANFFINTSTYFSRFELCVGDRIQIAGYTYSAAALNDPTYGQSLRAFCKWVNRPEGHIIVNTAYTATTSSTVLVDGFNNVGYANFLIIPALYQNPTTGSTLLDAFGTNFGTTLSTESAQLSSPIRLINLNRQLNLVFRIITREMDALPQIRPDNNY